MHNMSSYDSSKESLEHFKNYKGWMYLYAYINAARCQAF